MDSSASTRIDIFEIYGRFCDTKSRNAYFHGEEGYRQDSEIQKAQLSREALARLSKLVESRGCTGVTIFDELSLLMSRLDLMVDFAEFSRFYDFVFFMCREDGQKNISAWPVLIDDFVENMYRVSGSSYDSSNFHCNCGDPESVSCVFEDSFIGLKSSSGLKRKLPEDAQRDNIEASYLHGSHGADLGSLDCKRSRVITHGAVHWGNPLGDSTDDVMCTTKHNSPLCSSKSQCAVEGCLSKGFAGLLSTSSYVQFGRETRASFI